MQAVDSIEQKDKLQGLKVALSVSGGNITPAQLKEALDTYQPA